MTLRRGFSTSVLFILSVMRELTSPVIDRVKNKLTYPAADGGQKICFVAELERFSVRTVRAMAAILTTRMCVRTHTTQAHALTPRRQAAKRRRKTKYIAEAGLPKR